MYQDFFGLRELPFELTSNPKYLFMTPRHREALSNLQYGLATRKAITVLIGEAGTGKTTLLRAALDWEGCRNIKCIYINNPALTRDEFVETLARGFALSPDAFRSKATLLNELRPMLEQTAKSEEAMALVIDEAQRLSDDLLEEIRLLTNIETLDQKLLPLVLTGQPELADRLRSFTLRQLRQRVSLRCEITPFQLPETAAYIDHRIRVAGGQSVKLFTREAVVMMHEASNGIPRLINVIGDNALLGAFAKGAQRVTSDVVSEVCRDFDLGRPGAESRDAGAGDTVNPRSHRRPASRPEVPASIDAARGATPGVPERHAKEAAGGDAAPEPGDAPPRPLFSQFARRRRFSLFG